MGWGVYVINWGYAPEARARGVVSSLVHGYLSGGSMKVRLQRLLKHKQVQTTKVRHHTSSHLDTKQSVKQDTYNVIQYIKVIVM